MVKSEKRIQRVLLLRLKPSVYDSCYHPIGFRPPYTLKYIESLLIKQEICSVKLIDQKIVNLPFESILDTVKSWHPDLIVLSISTLDVNKSLEFCRLVRKNKNSKGIIIIGTGQEMGFGIAEEKSFNELFDVRLRGEAEEEVVSIIKKLNEATGIDKIKDYYNQKEFKTEAIKLHNLDRLPFPVYDLDSLKRYYFVYPLKVKRRLIWGHVLTSRGCPHNCIFCSQIMRETHGKRFRGRSAENIVDEIENLLKLGANIITLDDDNFTTSNEHVEAMCREIKLRKLHVQWIAHARVDEIAPSLFRLMKEAGCVLLRFGVESGSERIIKTLRKTNNSHSWIDKSRKAVSTAKLLGIGTVCLFIVGSPGETKEDFQKSIKLAQILSPDIIQVAYFTFFPDSMAYQMFSQRLRKNATSEMYHYKKPLVNFSAMNDQELERAQNVFYRSFLMRPVFILRHFYNYFFFYLHNPYIFRKFFRALKQRII